MLLYQVQGLGQLHLVKNLLIEVCIGLFICFVAIPVLLVLAGVRLDRGGLGVPVG